MLHHVVLKGVAACDIVLDDVDRGFFVQTISKHVHDGGARVLAWALQDNHIHIVVLVGELPLAKVVHGFAMRHAQFFNWRHARAGHLFQNRYWSCPIDSDAYFVNAIAYVFINPIMAGIVSDLEALARYRWAGYAGVMGGRDDPIISVPDVLVRFSDDPAEARRAIREAAAAALQRWRANPAWHWNPDAVGAPGVTAAIDSCALMMTRSTDLHSARAAWDARVGRANHLHAAGWTLDVLIAAVCTSAGLSPDELMTASRRPNVSRTRALVSFLASDQLRLGFAEIGRRLRIGESSVRRAAVVGAEIARREGVTVESLSGGCVPQD